MAEFMNDNAIGDEGYLLDKGLIPLPQDARSKYQSDSKNLANLKF